MCRWLWLSSTIHSFAFGAGEGSGAGEGYACKAASNASFNFALACRELSLLKRVRTGGGFDPKRDSRNLHAGLLFALPCWRGTSKPARTFQMHARAGSLEDAELSAGGCEIKAGIGVDFACVTFARASPFDCAKNEDMESSRQPQPPARVAGPSQVVLEALTPNVPSQVVAPSGMPEETPGGTKGHPQCGRRTWCIGNPTDDLLRVDFMNRTTAYYCKPCYDERSKPPQHLNPSSASNRTKRNIIKLNLRNKTK